MRRRRAWVVIGVCLGTLGCGSSSLSDSGDRPGSSEDARADDAGRAGDGSSTSIDAGDGAFEVKAVTPTPNRTAVPIDTSITVTFGRPVDPSSVNDRTVWAFGRWSGMPRIAFNFEDDGRTIRLTPSRPFSAGEQVTVFVSKELVSADQQRLRSGYSFQFWTAAAPATRTFVETDRHSTAGDDGEVISYGGVGADLNGDGWLDLGVVNEVTADLRVFLNTGDGTASFDDYLRPPASVGRSASPNESADFNADGVVDVCVANPGDDNVSVLLGRGDGTFEPEQELDVGGRPRGITVLDVDGDADMDIASTSLDDSAVSLLINDGAGRFEEGLILRVAGRARAIGAADMNGDGIFDLVVGTEATRRIHVLLGDGNGAFVESSSRDTGGEAWMLVTGDLDRDGSVDVAISHGRSGDAAILLGDGTGQLAAAVQHDSGEFTLASDLADLDGDGDLDWVVSNYDGDWTLFENDGGRFTEDQRIDAPQIGSCALLFDADNDADIDMALVDEGADQIIVMRNQ